MKVMKPVNQKSIYHSYSDLYEKIMGDEVTIEKAEQASHALDGMNRTYALEIKRAELEQSLSGNVRKVELRIVEAKAFDNPPIEENK